MANPARVQSVNSDIAQFPHDAISEELRRDRRLRILQTLKEIPGKLTNEAVLKNALRSFGHAVSSDLIRTELSWLEEQGLVSVSKDRDLYVVALSERGDDVASGLATQPGISTS